MINLTIILKQYKVIFFLSGKCANSSIKAAIKKMQGIEKPIHSGHEYIDACRALKKKEFLKIAVVRNPWARFVSCYCQKIVGPKPAQLVKMKNIYKGMPFDDFVKEVCRLPRDIGEQHIRLQTRTMLCKNEFVPEWIIKLENIEWEWQRLQEIIPIPDLVPRNTTEHPHYSRYYNDETRELIGKRYSKDIKIFNYEFEVKR